MAAPEVVEPAYLYGYTKKQAPEIHIGASSSSSSSSSSNAARIKCIRVKTLLSGSSSAPAASLLAANEGEDDRTIATEQPTVETPSPLSVDKKSVRFLGPHDSDQREVRHDRVYAPSLAGSDVAARIQQNSQLDASPEDDDEKFDSSSFSFKWPLRRTVTDLFNRLTASKTVAPDTAREEPWRSVRHDGDNDGDDIDGIDRPLTMKKVSVSLQSKPAFLQTPEQRMLQYWQERFNSCVQQYGSAHPQTIHVTLHLGRAHLNCHDFDRAQQTFRLAMACCGTNNSNCSKDTSILLAKTQDHLGEALIRCGNLLEAKLALESAYNIRSRHLGPAHVDSIDTLHKLAAVHLHAGHYEAAILMYNQTLDLRTRLFSKSHASVAVSAQCLGRAHVLAGEREKGIKYLRQALEIFTKHLYLPRSHPSVQRVEEELERVEQCSGRDFASSK